MGGRREKKKGKKSVDRLAMGFCCFFVVVFLSFFFMEMLNLIFLFSQRIPRDET